MLLAASHVLFKKRNNTVLLSPYRVKQICYGAISVVASRTCGEISRLNSVCGVRLLAAVTYIPRLSAVSSLASLPYDRGRFLAAVTHAGSLAALTYRVDHTRDASFKRLEVDGSATRLVTARGFRRPSKSSANRCRKLAGLPACRLSEWKDVRRVSCFVAGLAGKLAGLSYAKSEN